MMSSLRAAHPQVGLSDRTCDTLQQAHPGWLVFHNAQSGLWSAYRHVLSGRPEPGAVLLVRAESAEELDRKLAAQTPPAVPPSIRAVAATRALQARTAHAVRAAATARTGWAGQRPPALRRLLRS
ncbi:hypothetical protein [Streptosporangium saharense]|uniref:Uncharacterized protein n=1 Tax=Streptosporangium saharense TaxID=1706840 RepID=A0A7W7VJT2_9ACTN|nr:hypothetical protein [Streptosporangium saharense]MBB4912931.1 hypothetical protein [Streptosporangium saharense]